QPPSSFFNSSRSDGIVAGTSKSVFTPGEVIKHPAKPAILRRKPHLIVGNGTTGRAHEDSFERVVQLTGTSALDKTHFNNGRIMIKCDFCTVPVDEREIVKHIKTFHGLVTSHTTQITKIMKRCKEPACDFACETEEENISHVQHIHRDPYKDWASKGRFKLITGSQCPYCTESVRDVASLCQHLIQMHRIKMNFQKEVFSCSCSTRFSRLYQIYEHWHTSACPGSIKIDQPASIIARSLPPPAIVQRGHWRDLSGMITGPRDEGRLMSLSIKERISKEPTLLKRTACGTKTPSNFLSEWEAKREKKVQKKKK
ncbi:hypothetical protein PENTCL1PPCAC_29749, partial [Pristionchus entomophagus]